MVANTPIVFVFVFNAAGLIAGSIPINGILNSSLSFEIEFVVAVLQATTMILHFFSIKNLVLLKQILSISFWDFPPYGQFLESDRYIVFSCGRRLFIDFHRVIPPTPESKKPIGYKLI